MENPPRRITPGPAIGRSNATPGPSFTAPDFRHCASASARHGSRDSNHEGLQPASATATTEPGNEEGSPRMRAKMGSSAVNDSSSFCGGFAAGDVMVKNLDRPIAFGSHRDTTGEVT